MYSAAKLNLREGRSAAPVPGPGGIPGGRCSVRGRRTARSGRHGGRSRHACWGVPTHTRARMHARTDTPDTETPHLQPGPHSVAGVPEGVPPGSAPSFIRLQAATLPRAPSVPLPHAVQAPPPKAAGVPPPHSQPLWAHDPESTARPRKDLLEGPPLVRRQRL